MGLHRLLQRGFASLYNYKLPSLQQHERLGMDSILAKCLGSDNSVPKQHNDDLEARDAYWESVLGADNAKDLHFKLQGVRYCSEYQ